MKNTCSTQSSGSQNATSTGKIKIRYPLPDGVAQDQTFSHFLTKEDIEGLHEGFIKRGCRTIFLENVVFVITDNGDVFVTIDLQFISRAFAALHTGHYVVAITWELELNPANELPQAASTTEGDR